MADLLWGRVYYKEHFAGFLREEPGERTSFAYDATYLDSSNLAIAHTLPLSVTFAICSAFMKMICRF